jgi:hypothetical protein
VEVFGERHQSASDGCAMLHLLHSIAEGKQSVERDKPLVVEHGADPTRHFRVHALTFTANLPGTSKQLDDFILRPALFSSCDK